MTINCIIVEDEPLAMDRLKSFVERVPFLKLMACMDNAMEAIGYLRTEQVDLLFLDIQMDGFTGIQLLEALSKRPEVIITTAFDQYALKGFDLNVSDYLLKPFTFERFMQAVGRVYDKLTPAKTAPQSSFIFIKTEHRLEKVNFADILFIEGMRDYRCLHLADRKLLTLQTFSELEQALPADLFCRVHKSFIVPLNRIESIERDRIRINEVLIPISETYKDSFYRRIPKAAH